MKLMIASDIHGSAKFCREMLQRFAEEKADRLLLLGGENYGLTIGSQSILIGLCYANGLSPITGKYGIGYGMLAAGLHYLLVTAVPDMHAGFCLYNGGFTAALICLLFVPQLEKFCKTKEERKAAKAQK